MHVETFKISCSAAYTAYFLKTQIHNKRVFGVQVAVGNAGALGVASAWLFKPTTQDETSWSYTITDHPKDVVAYVKGEGAMPFIPGGIYVNDLAIMAISNNANATVSVYIYLE